MIKNSAIFFRIGIIAFWLIAIGLLLAIPSINFLSRGDKTINVLTWAATIDPNISLDFEKKTGIKVNFSYFENNEELFVKLLTTKGRDYDLIMPSDYTVPKLIKYKLVKMLDKSKIDFWQRIDSRLLDCYFDPKNNYTVPYFWAVYGLGINRNFFDKDIPSSWSLLFNCSAKNGKVAMLNTAREAMLLTSQYLFGSIEDITTEKIKAIKETLIKQKSCVETYIDADYRTNYLLASETSPVAVVATPYIAELLKENNAIEFILPKEGSFILIDSLALTKGTMKDDLVYEFINYLYKPAILLHHFKNYPFFPVTNDTKKLMEEYNIPLSIIDAHYNKTLNLDFFKNVISEHIANAVWMILKTS